MSIALHRHKLQKQQLVLKFISAACVHSLPFGIWVATESDTWAGGGLL
jgi:hypothetical protein